MLGGQPPALLFGLRDIDPLDFEDHRPGAVVAAGNHHPVVPGPLAHDGAPLEGGVDVSADGVPGLSAEPAVHQVVEVVLLRGALEQEGVPTRVQTAIEMQKVAEPFIVRRANRHLEKSRVVIFGAGTGNPYFSTDTTAALRASEIGADVILMAKNGVDGVYNADPKTNPDAVKYDTLTYMDLIQEGLAVMDTTATSMCMDNDIDLVVFNMNEHGNILKAVQGDITGTVITKERK